MDDIMDKADKLFEELEKAGVEFGVGQTAIVCADGVALINVDDESGVCDLMLCNSKVDFTNYSLGITDEDVEHFKTVAGIATEMGLQEDE
jgi:hypothetical protein